MLLTQAQLNREEYVFAGDFRGTPAETVTTYLAGTPLYQPFMTAVPFSFDDVRFQHQWVVAPTGSGKTQLLKAQIAADLHRVARGEVLRAITKLLRMRDRSVVRSSVMPSAK